MSEEIIQAVHEELEAWEVFEDVAPSEINAIARVVVRIVKGGAK